MWTSNKKIKIRPYLFWAMWKENLKILVVELSKKQVSRQKICCPSIAPRLYIMSNSSESIYLHILSFVVFHDYSLPWFISVDYIWFSYHKHFMNKNKPAFSVVYLILWWSILNLSVYALSWSPHNEFKDLKHAYETCWVLMIVWTIFTLYQSD